MGGVKVGIHVRQIRKRLFRRRGRFVSGWIAANEALYQTNPILQKAYAPIVTYPLIRIYVSLCLSSTETVQRCLIQSAQQPLGFRLCSHRWISVTSGKHLLWSIASENVHTCFVSHPLIPVTVEQPDRTFRRTSSRLLHNSNIEYWQLTKHDRSFDLVVHHSIWFPHLALCVKHHPYERCTSVDIQWTSSRRQHSSSISNNPHTNIQLVEIIFLSSTSPCSSIGLTAVLVFPSLFLISQVSMDLSWAKTN